MLVAEWEEEIKKLSPKDREKYRKAIDTLRGWPAFKKEFCDLGIFTLATLPEMAWFRCYKRKNLPKIAVGACEKKQSPLCGRRRCPHYKKPTKEERQWSLFLAAVKSRDRAAVVAMLRGNIKLARLWFQHEPKPKLALFN